MHKQVSPRVNYFVDSAGHLFFKLEQPRDFTFNGVKHVNLHTLITAGETVFMSDEYFSSHLTPSGNTTRNAVWTLDTGEQCTMKDLINDLLIPLIYKTCPWYTGDIEVTFLNHGKIVTHNITSNILTNKKNLTAQMEKYLEMDIDAWDIKRKMQYDNTIPITPHIFISEEPTTTITSLDYRVVFM